MSVSRQLTSVTAMSCSLPKRRIPFQKYVEYAEAKSEYFVLISSSTTGIFNTFISFIHSIHFQQLIYPKINNSKLPIFLKMRLKEEKQEIFEISLNDPSFYEFWKHSLTYFVH